MIKSRTYKIKLPDHISTHAVYFTIVGYPPTSFFVNCKSMESFQWITALMTGISRQVAAGVDIEKIVIDMKETFDPGGSYFLEDGTGREVNSLVHHLGLIIERYINNPNEEQEEIEYDSHGERSI